MEKPKNQEKTSRKQIINRILELELAIGVKEAEEQGRELYSGDTTPGTLTDETKSLEELKQEHAELIKKRDEIDNN